MGTDATRLGTSHQQKLQQDTEPALVTPMGKHPWQCCPAKGLDLQKELHSQKETRRGEREERKGHSTRQSLSSPGPPGELSRLVARTDRGWEKQQVPFSPQFLGHGPPRNLPVPPGKSPRSVAAGARACRVIPPVPLGRWKVIFSLPHRADGGSAPFVVPPPHRTHRWLRSQGGRWPAAGRTTGHPVWSLFGDIPALRMTRATRGQALSV